MSEVKTRKATPAELACLQAKLGDVKRDAVTKTRIARLKAHAKRAQFEPTNGNELTKQEKSWLDHVFAEDRRCPHCGRMFHPIRTNQKFCSAGCSHAHSWQQGGDKTYCHDCGKETDGASRCPACAAKKREQNRRARERYRAQGRCINCGKPAAPGHTRCAACLRKAAATQRRIDQRKREGR